VHGVPDHGAPHLAGNAAGAAGHLQLHLVPAYNIVSETFTVAEGALSVPVVLDEFVHGQRGQVPLRLRFTPAVAGDEYTVEASQRVVHVTTQYALVTIDARSLQVLRTIGLPNAPKRVVAVDERTGATWYGGAGESTLTLRGAPLGDMGS